MAGISGEAGGQEHAASPQWTFVTLVISTAVAEAHHLEKKPVVYLSVNAYMCMCYCGLWMSS